MRLQRFRAPNDWEIVGETVVRKDHLARIYADDARVAIVRPLGVFTELICADGTTRCVMTSDWAQVQRLGSNK